MNTFVLTSEEARRVVWGEHEDWIPLNDTKQIIDHGRWSVHYKQVFKHISTNKYYMIEWSVGATEIQDLKPFQYKKEAHFVEVERQTVLTQIWSPKK